MLLTLLFSFYIYKEIVEEEEEGEEEKR